MSAAEEVGSAWREDADRLHTAIVRLEELVEKSKDDLEVALTLLFRIRHWDVMASGTADEVMWRREIDALLERLDLPQIIDNPRTNGCTILPGTEVEIPEWVMSPIPDTEEGDE